MSASATAIQGRSDDLICFYGELLDESCAYEFDESNPEDHDGSLVFLSDATVLEVRYGKPGLAIWEIKLVRQGPLFERIDLCVEETGGLYSDTAHFRSGLKWAYVMPNKSRPVVAVGKPT